jgi:hypothetical protein
VVSVVGRDHHCVSVDTDAVGVESEGLDFITQNVEVQQSPGGDE